MATCQLASRLCVPSCAKFPRQKSYRVFDRSAQAVHLVARCCPLRDAAVHPSAVSALIWAFPPCCKLGAWLTLRPTFQGNTLA